MAKEIGASGTDIQFGYISDEYLTDLSFEQRLDVFDKMRRSDATVKAILKSCKLPILSATYFFQPASENSKDVEIADFCRDVFFKYISWTDFLSHALTELDFGFAVFEKVYELTEDNKIIYKKLAPRLAKSIQKWEMENGKEGITQNAFKNGKYENISIPWSKIFHIANDQEGDNLEGISILRPAYKHWYYKDALYTIQGIASEKTGVGVPTAKRTIDEPIDPKEREQVKEALEELRANEKAHIILPYGWEFDFVSAKGGSFNFKEAISHHDRQIAKTVLAQFLDISASGSSGGYSQSESETFFFYRSVKAIIANLIERVQRDLVREIVDLNFDVENYPKLKVVDIEPIDVLKLSSAVEKLAKSGILQVDDLSTENYLRNTLNLPEIRERATINPKKEEKQEEKKEEVSKKATDEGFFLDKNRFYRKLTLAEKKIDWDSYEGFLNKYRDEIYSISFAILKLFASDVAKSIKKSLKTKTPLSIDLEKKYQIELAKKIKSKLIEIYEFTKISTSKELGIKPKRVKNETIFKKFITTESYLIAEYQLNAIKTEMRLRALELAKKQLPIDGKLPNSTIDSIIKEITSVGLAKIETISSNYSSIAVSGIANTGIASIYNINKDIIWGYQYSAILDNRTSALCLSLDGRVTRKIENMPHPPLHFRCRSRIVAILMDQEEKPEINEPPKSITSKISSSIWSTPAIKTPVVRKGSPAASIVQKEIAERLIKIKSYKESGKYLNRIKQHEARIAELRKKIS